jgi:hypothetical protein
MSEPGDSGDGARKRLGAVLAIVGVIAAAIVVALGTGAVTLPGAQDGSDSAQTSAQASVAARQIAANEQWASAACTSILNWKNEIHRDEAGLSFSLDALPRIEDAVAVSARTLAELDKLGLPPAVQTAQERAEIDQFRAEIESRVRGLETAAGSVASGNLAAIGTLLDDLENAKGLEAQIVGGLRRIVPVDLGLSLVETGACRQLVGITI